VRPLLLGVRGGRRPAAPERGGGELHRPLHRDGRHGPGPERPAFRVLRHDLRDSGRAQAGGARELRAGRAGGGQRVRGDAAGRLAIQTDPLVIGATLGVSQIPYYAVANNFVVYALEFIVAIAAVVMPTTTRLKTQGRLAELRAIFLRWSKIAFCLTMIVGLFLIVLGPRFIGWWIDASFEGPAGAVLQILMISSLIFLPVRGV